MYKNNNETVKECSGCENLLPLSSFQDRRNNTCGKDKLCKACRNEYLGKWREQKFSEDPYKSLLYSSVQNSFYRGQAVYTKPPYQNVRCDWDSINQYFNDLYNDEAWMNDWRNMVDTYLETGNDADKPSIGRINHDLHYSRDNIQVQSLGANKSEAVSKPCQLFIISKSNLSQVEILDFNTKQELRNYLIGMDVPVNTMNAIDEGIIHEAGKGMRILIQTRDGVLKGKDAPLHRLEWHYQKFIIDYETNKEYLVIDNKFGFDTGGIRLGKGVTPITPNSNKAM